MNLVTPYRNKSLGARLLILLLGGWRDRWCKECGRYVDSFEEAFVGGGKDDLR
jgi:hypothetical protein